MRRPPACLRRHLCPLADADQPASSTAAPTSSSSTSRSRTTRSSARRRLTRTSCRRSRRRRPTRTSPPSPRPGAGSPRSTATSAATSTAASSGSTRSPRSLRRDSGPAGSPATRSLSQHTLPPSSPRPSTLTKGPSFFPSSQVPGAPVPHHRDVDQRPLVLHPVAPRLVPLGRARLGARRLHPLDRRGPARLPEQARRVRRRDRQVLPVRCRLPLSRACSINTSDKRSFPRPTSDEYVSTVPARGGMFQWVNVQVEKHYRFKANEAGETNTNELMQELFGAWPTCSRARLRETHVLTSPHRATTLHTDTLVAQNLIIYPGGLFVVQSPLESRAKDTPYIRALDPPSFTRAEFRRLTLSFPPRPQAARSPARSSSRTRRSRSSARSSASSSTRARSAAKRPSEPPPPPGRRPSSCPPSQL